MRRRESGFDLLISLPWYIALAIGAGLYLGASTIAAFVAGVSPMLSKSHQAIVSIVHLVAYVCLAAAVISFIRGLAVARRFAAQRLLADMRALTWQQFEVIVGEAFRRTGYSVLETGQGGADGGVDLVLSKAGQRYLVQCKQYRAATVSVMVVREIFGIVAARRAAGAIVVTTGAFTKDAVEFARAQPIELIDGPALEAMVRNINVGGTSRPPAEAKAAIRPIMVCPQCGAPMVQRVARRGGALFLGCSTFPKCRGTRPV